MLSRPLDFSACFLEPESVWSRTVYGARQFSNEASTVAAWFLLPRLSVGPAGSLQCFSLNKGQYFKILCFQCDVSSNVLSSENSQKMFDILEKTIERVTFTFEEVWFRHFFFCLGSNTICFVDTRMTFFHSKKTQRALVVNPGLGDTKLSTS